MKNIINLAEVTKHTIKLQQLGAKVIVIKSTLCYVNFDVDGVKIQYAYNVNHKGNYFLERIKPYPLAIEELGTEKDVIKLISKDVDKFKNALKGRHIDSFITIAKQISTTFSAFEDAFLNYKIPDEKVEKIYKKILALDIEIDVIREAAEALYEPEEDYTQV